MQYCITSCDIIFMLVAHTAILFSVSKARLLSQHKQKITQITHLLHVEESYQRFCCGWSTSSSGSGLMIAGSRDCLSVSVVIMNGYHWQNLSLTYTGSFTSSVISGPSLMGQDST